MGAFKRKARCSPQELPPLLQSLLGWRPPREPETEIDPFADLKTCPVISYCEATLLQLPWAVLEAQRSRRPHRVQFEVDGELPKGHADRSWRVGSGPSGLPGPFEREVFRALEWIALEKFHAQGRRFQNPLYFQVPEVCERLCLKELSTNYRAVDRAIRDLAEVDIERTSLSAWSRSRETPAFSQRVRLIDRVAFDPRPGPHRRPAFRRHALYFGRYFVDSINAGRIRAMNWSVWIALKQTLSRRLLEILDFDSGLTAGRRELGYSLENLARLVPLREGFRSQAVREALDRAHAELIDQKYLESAEWIGSSPEARIVYRPGVAQTSIARLLRRQGLPVPPYRSLAPGCAAGSA